jgi:hypothetical protein
MALTKETVTDLTQVTELGSIQVRKATYILEDGMRIAGPIYVRVAYVPGADVATESDRVKAIAAVVWTADVIREHRERSPNPTRQ